MRRRRRVTDRWRSCAWRSAWKLLLRSSDHSITIEHCAPAMDLSKRPAGSGGYGVSQLLDPDRRGLELGCARLWVGRVDRQQVGRDVVLEMERHEGKAWSERCVDPDRRCHAPAARDDTYAFTFGQAIGLGVLG